MLAQSVVVFINTTTDWANTLSNKGLTDIIFFDFIKLTDTWLSAQGDEAKTVELAPRGFGVKSFPHQSQSRGGGIAIIYKYILGSNITFKTKFDFTHTSFEVVQASITIQNYTLHFFCSYRPPPNRRSNLTDYVY